MSFLLQSPKLAILVFGAVAGAVLVTLLVCAEVPLRYNRRNLTVRWWTTLLTVLAFVLVVGLLVVMMAFVNGMYALTQTSGYADNVIILSDGATDELVSTMDYNGVGNIELQPKIARDPQGKPLCSRETYIVASLPILNPDGTQKRRRFVQIRGIDDATIAEAVHRMPVEGRWFSGAGVQAKSEGSSETRIEAVIGKGIASTPGADMGRGPLQPGDTFSVGGKEWIVTGILQSTGTTYDSEIWAKRSLVALLFGKDTYTTLVLKAESAAAASELAKYFANEYKEAQLSARTEPEYYQGLQGTNLQFLFTAILISAVMALGGTFGIMNTMFAAISQRSKDIGVLQILGFSPRQVLLSFLIESIFLALIGGLIGCAIGSLVHNWSVTSLVGAGQGGKTVVFRMLVDPTILTLGMLFAFVMGLIGGIVPAFSAMTKKPLDALR